MLPSEVDSKPHQTPKSKRSSEQSTPKSSCLFLQKAPPHMFDKAPTRTVTVEFKL